MQKELSKLIEVYGRDAILTSLNSLTTESELDLGSEVDKALRLELSIEQDKKELEKVKAKLQIVAEEQLKDSKSGQVSFYGKDTHGIVTVQNTATVKAISEKDVYKLFKDDTENYISKSVNYTLKATLKSAMQPILTGEYIIATLEDTVKQITDDDKKRTVLMKKLKGKYEKDVNTLQSVLGYSRYQAETDAYIVKEVIAYETLKVILNSLGVIDIQECITELKKIMLVEENIKVTVKGKE